MWSASQSWILLTKHGHAAWVILCQAAFVFACCQLWTNSWNEFCLHVVWASKDFFHYKYFSCVRFGLSENGRETKKIFPHFICSTETRSKSWIPRGHSERCFSSDLEFPFWLKFGPSEIRKGIGPTWSNGQTEKPMETKLKRLQSTIRRLKPVVKWLYFEVCIKVLRQKGAEIAQGWETCSLSAPPSQSPEQKEPLHFFSNTNESCQILPAKCVCCPQILSLGFTHFRIGLC